MDPAATALLRQVPIFAGLEDRTLSVLAEHSRHRVFQPNSTLFYEGDEGTTLYVLISGCVRIHTTSASGEVIHLAMRGPGEVIGEMSLIDGKRRMADATAAALTEALLLDRADFVRCIEASPRVAFSIMACLSDRLREAAVRLQDVQSGNVLGRLSGWLLKTAETGGTPAAAAGIRIEFRLTHQELAEQIGARRETVSRALADLKGVGAIRQEGKGRLVITDQARLRRYRDA